MQILSFGFILLGKEEKYYQNLSSAEFAQRDKVKVNEMVYLLTLAMLYK